MKKIGNFFCGLCFLSLFVTHTYGQKSDIQPVKKGEVVPDLPLVLHTGDTVSNVHLSDYKGKLVLLDFWGVHCPDCIAGLPHILAMQEQFKDKIRIIVVAADDRQAVKDLFGKLKGHFPEAIMFAGSHLPFVMGDTVLNKMFPHRGVPDHVWIDGDQIFRHITYDNSTTPTNIEAFLEGKPVRLADKYAESIHEDEPLTWLNVTGVASENVPDYSFFMKRMVMTSDLNGSMHIDRDSLTNKVVGLAISNKRIVDLYKDVFALKNGGKYVPSTKIYLDVHDVNKYVMPSDESRVFPWLDSNTFCYAIKVPLSQSDGLEDKMYRDLDKFFSLQSSIEDKNVKCWALRLISKEDKLSIEDKKAKSGINVDRNGKQWRTIKNGEMENLFNSIEEACHFSNEFRPVFDETGYTGKVNIVLPFAEDGYSLTVDELRQTLRKYGLDLVEEYRTLNMLVIKDAPPGNPKEMARK